MRTQRQKRGAGQSVGLQVTGSGKPSATDPGNVVSTAGGTGAVGIGQSSSTKRTTVGRGQIGVKTVAGASAASVRMRVPIKARLELHSPSGTVTPVEIDNLHLVHRILEHDRRAGERLQPVRAHRNPGQLMQRKVGDATPARLKTWRDTGAQLPMEAQVNGFRGAAELRGAIAATMAAANASKKFHKTGVAAAYAQREAVSSEWLIAALPLLVSAGVDLPSNHASGVEGQDPRCSLHARLRGGRVLDIGDSMTFEAVGQSALDGSRPTAIDNQQAAEHKSSLRPNGGLGRLDAGPYRNEAVGTADFTGGATDTGANASGSMPLHKPKFDSVLAQFTVEFRIVARVSHRHTQSIRSAAGSTSMRDYVLPVPVVVRLPKPAAAQMLADAGTRARLTDPYKLFAPPAEGVGAGTGTSG